MPIDELDAAALKAEILAWGKELGFQQIGVCDTDLEAAETNLNEWLARNA